MKSVKDIIATLSKAENVAIVKKCVVLDSYVGEVNDTTGACPVVLTLDKEVPGMVQLSKSDIEDMTNQIAELDVQIKTAKTAKDDALVDTLTETKKNLEEFIQSHHVDDWYKGMTNRIFTSNLAIVGCLRQNPETTGLIEAVQADESLIKGLMNQAVINVIAEDVHEGEVYHNPFSSNDDNDYDVEHDSVFHSIYGLKLSNYGEDAADDIKQILAEITKERLMTKLRGNRRRARRTEVDDDED